MFAVIPVKSFRSAKTRLRPLFSDAEREELALCMAADVLNAVAAAASVTDIAVVTHDPAAAALARRFGCEVLAEPPAASLSEIVGQAFAVLRARGIGDYLYLPADVPLITSAHLDEFLRARIAGAALVRARRDGGTNALVLMAGAAIPLAFGPGSCRRHALRARHAGVPVQLVSCPALECDIDTPDDVLFLANAQESPTSPASRTQCAQVHRGRAQQFARRICERHPDFSSLRNPEYDAHPSLSQRGSRAR